MCFPNFALSAGSLCLGLSPALCAEMTQGYSSSAQSSNWKAWVISRPMSLNVSGPSNATKIRNDFCARDSALPPSDEVAGMWGSPGGCLLQEEEQLEKLDLHAQLCLCRPSSLPAPHFSPHELICPDSCQISPLAPEAWCCRRSSLPRSTPLKAFSVILQGRITLT